MLAYCRSALGTDRQVRTMLQNPNQSPRHLAMATQSLLRTEVQTVAGPVSWPVQTLMEPHLGPRRVSSSSSSSSSMSASSSASSESHRPRRLCGEAFRSGAGRRRRLCLCAPPAAKASGAGGWGLERSAPGASPSGPPRGSRCRRSCSAQAPRRAPLSGLPSPGRSCRP